MGYDFRVQVHYFLVPQTDRPFADLVEARLRKIPAAFRHPDPRDRSWVIAASPQMGKWLEAKLRVDPRTSLATQGVVTIHPASLEIWQDAPREILASLEPLVTWILQTWPCQVFSEDSDDWTARYAHDPHALFVEEDAWG